jgi:hypothetical protein
MVQRQNMTKIMHLLSTDLGHTYHREDISDILKL